MGRKPKPEVAGYLTTALRLPPDLHAALRMQALAQGRTMNELIVEAIAARVQIQEVSDFVARWKAAGKRGRLLDSESWQAPAKK